MSQRSDILTQLVRTALGRGKTVAATAASEIPEARDGNAPGVVAAALAAPHDGVPGEPVEGGGEPEFDPGIVGILSEKVLLAWLRNRYQLLFPFALDLRRLDERQAGLLVHAMIAAAQADGSFDKQERDRIAGTLDLVNPSADESAFLTQAIENPTPLNGILSAVRDVQTGALVYAASLMAVDRRQPVNRYYLRYLAARLQLSDELAKSLEQRYG
jgi:hypothetical protein